MGFLIQRRSSLFGLLVAAAAVVGCGGSAAFVGERLDPLTSVTIRYSEPPLVL